MGTSSRITSSNLETVKRSSKITMAAVAALLVAGGGVVGGLRWSRRDLVTVQTGVAMRGDLTAVVTASGEIKPRNYINLGANAQGPITELLIKEGDRVRKGQVVARIEHIGVGGDYDGVDQLPEGLADVSRYPALIAELRDRGWSDADCGALASGNILRVLRDAEAAAAEISATRPPSVARIEDLDAAEPVG